jgi:hypothetical protein
MPMAAQVDWLSTSGQGSGFRGSQPQWWETRYVNDSIKVRSLQQQLVAAGGGPDPLLTKDILGPLAKLSKVLL